MELITFALGMVVGASLASVIILLFFIFGILDIEEDGDEH